MKIIAHYLAYAVLLISFATLGVPAEKQLFSLTITPPSEPLKSGTELHLLVTVTNISDRTIGFIRSPGQPPEEGFRYEIEVRNERGLSASPSAYLRDLKNKTTVSFSGNLALWIKPGESFVDEIQVTKFYDLSQPGKYTISVARDIPPAQNLGKGTVRSNTVTVTVTK